MSLDAFLEKLNTSPEAVTFDEAIAIIDEHYAFSDTAFLNGDTQNAAGQNNGSCKIFAFGDVNKLTKDQTLHCFGDYYRKDVLGSPDADDYQNIRNFIKQGWPGIRFEGEALALRQC